MPECLIGLGSNINHRLANIRQAIEHMTVFLRITRMSSIYETEPVEYRYQGWFLNMVVKGFFDGDPLELLFLTQEHERNLNPKKPFKYAPRIIDIDILTFDKMIVNTPEITLPHPGITERRFILEPVKEIKPDFIHPVSGLVIDELIETCVDKSAISKVGNLLPYRI